jgi:hypothetical protein
MVRSSGTQACAPVEGRRYLTHAALRAAAPRSPLWTAEDAGRAAIVARLDPAGRYPLLAAYPAGDPGKRLCAVAVGAEHGWLVRVELTEAELASLPTEPPAVGTTPPPARLLSFPVDASTPARERDAR